ncbi:hypothetical protein PR048_008820 [Dryococelus australis]|uniref:Uncharacterized protein n=1 Tax=Dryococelus australis TaxID=614101 RepID=A0ABQ9HY71_9NEOP|nr:hypothetical protein PR048_008820 [Dryococelus australis]
MRQEGRVQWRCDVTRAVLEAVWFISRGHSSALSGQQRLKPGLEGRRKRPGGRGSSRYEGGWRESPEGLWGLRGHENAFLFAARLRELCSDSRPTCGKIPYSRCVAAKAGKKVRSCEYSLLRHWVSTSVGAPAIYCGLSVRSQVGREQVIVVVTNGPASNSFHVIGDLAKHNGEMKIIGRCPFLLKLHRVMYIQRLTGPAESGFIAAAVTKRNTMSAITVRHNGAICPDSLLMVGVPAYSYFAVHAPIVATAALNNQQGIDTNKLAVADGYRVYIYQESHLMCSSEPGTWIYNGPFITLTPDELPRMEVVPFVKMARATPARASSLTLPWFRRQSGASRPTRHLIQPAAIVLALARAHAATSSQSYPLAGSTSPSAEITISKACTRAPSLMTSLSTRPHYCVGAAVAERLACSPPTKANRIFPSGNRAGRCGWSAGFLGDLPSPLHSGAAPFSPHFIFIGSQDFVVREQSKISQFNSQLNITACILNENIDRCKRDLFVCIGVTGYTARDCSPTPVAANPHHRLPQTPGHARMVVMCPSQQEESCYFCPRDLPLGLASVPRPVSLPLASHSCMARSRRYFTYKEERVKAVRDKQEWVKIGESAILGPGLGHPCPAAWWMVFLLRGGGQGGMRASAFDVNGNMIMAYQCLRARATAALLLREAAALSSSEK